MYSVETNLSKKSSISISSKKITISLILVYCFFAFCMSLFLIISFLPKNILNVAVSYFENETHNKVKIEQLILISFCTFLFCTLLAFIKRFLIYKKNESKPQNINIYQRELPEKLRPAHVRVLIYDGIIDSNTLASTILDLVNCGYLKLKLKIGKTYLKKK